MNFTSNNFEERKALAKIPLTIDNINTEYVDLISEDIFKNNHSFYQHYWANNQTLLPLRWRQIRKYIFLFESIFAQIKMFQQ